MDRFFQKLIDLQDKGLFKYIIIVGFILMTYLVFTYKFQTVVLCKQVCQEKYMTSDFYSGLYSCICYYNQTPNVNFTIPFNITEK
jgi:hypothetical protein